MLTDTENWRTKLNSAQLTTVSVEEDIIVTDAQEIAFAMITRDGRIPLENELPGLGWHPRLRPFALLRTSTASAQVSQQALAVATN